MRSEAFKFVRNCSGAHRSVQARVGAFRCARLSVEVRVGAFRSRKRRSGALRSARVRVRKPAMLSKRLTVTVHQLLKSVAPRFDFYGRNIPVTNVFLELFFCPHFFIKLITLILHLGKFHWHSLRTRLALSLTSCNKKIRSIFIHF